MSKLLFVVAILFFSVGLYVAGLTGEELDRTSGFEHGIDHTSLITIKEKFNTWSVLGGSYYLVTDYNNTQFELITCNSFNDYLSIERDQNYQITWYYSTGGLHISKISPSNTSGRYTIDTTVIKLKHDTPPSLAATVVSAFGLLVLVGMALIFIKPDLLDKILKPGDKK